MSTPINGGTPNDPHQVYGAYPAQGPYDAGAPPPRDARGPGAQASHFDGIAGGGPRAPGGAQRVRWGQPGAGASGAGYPRENAQGAGPGHAPGGVPGAGPGNPHMQGFAPGGAYPHYGPGMQPGMPQPQPNRGRIGRLAALAGFGLLTPLLTMSMMPGGMSFGAMAPLYSLMELGTVGCLIYSMVNRGGRFGGRGNSYGPGMGQYGQPWQGAPGSQPWGPPPAWPPQQQYYATPPAGQPWPGQWPQQPAAYPQAQPYPPAPGYPPPPAYPPPSAHSGWRGPYPPQNQTFTPPAPRASWPAQATPADDIPPRPARPPIVLPPVRRNANDQDA